MKRLGSIIFMDLQPVEKPSTSYTRLRVRSHGKGTFYEQVEDPQTVDMKTLYIVKENQLLVNITFAWEHAICVTSQEDAGKLVSHRFPTYAFNDNNNALFYKHFILQPKFKYQLKVASPGGAGRNRVLNKSAFLNIVVPKPSLPEQTKIANFLSLFDTKIEQQAEKVATLEEYKKGLLQKIFTRQMRFKDDDGKDYPEWEEVKVSEIFTLMRGIVIAKNKLSSIKADAYLYPVFSSQTSNNGILGYDKTYDFIGDHLTWTTDGANAGRVFFRSNKFRCTNVCGVLLEKDETKGYANILIKELLNRETPKHVSYVGNPKLMNNIMSSIRITIPTHPEQTKISNFLTLFDRKIEKEIGKLDALRELKKGLLQQMFI